NIQINVAPCLGSLGQAVARCWVIAIPVPRSMTAAGEPEIMTLTEIVLTILLRCRSQKLRVLRLELCTIFGHRLQAGWREIADIVILIQRLSTTFIGLIVC